MYPALNSFLQDQRGSALEKAEQDKFQKFDELLAQANELFDLTALPREQWESGHFIDSLLLLPFFKAAQGKHCIDVGSGAGFPGIPLAICLPELKFTLLEPMQKRAVFLKQVTAELGLEHVVVEEERAEEFGRERGRGLFDFATARAVAPLPILAELCAPLLRSGGTLLANKGSEAEGELEAASDALKVLGLELIEHTHMPVPSTAIQRSILHVQKSYPTAERFPRSMSAMKKRPL